MPGGRAAEPDPAWRPRGDRRRWERRARLIAGVREFFAARGVLEVETPVLGACGAMDPAICSFSTTGPDGRTRWLQSSPEYAMKRMLAAGSGPIFQISRAFRAGEAGPRHNPEFALLEWYRPDFDHHRLMDEVGDLIVSILGCEMPRRVSYVSAFRELAGIDIDSDSDESLRERVRVAGASERTAAELERDGCLDLLLTHVVEPGLSRLAGACAVFLYDYPASQAALARVERKEDVERAERFELYVDGLELANGYHELTDAIEQQARFEAERQRREHLGLARMEADERLTAALAHGLPRCSGVALGLDRLFMLALGVSGIEEAITFPDAIA